MSSHCSVTCLLCLLASVPPAGGQEPFTVVKVEPADGATGVPVDASVRVHVSGKFDPDTVNAESVRLLGPGGKAVPAVLGNDLGGVITVSPKGDLQAEAAYEVRVGSGLRDRRGRGVAAFRSTFTTGAGRAIAVKKPALAFRQQRVAEMQGLTTLTVGPDGNVYAGTWTGEVWRWLIDPKTGEPTGRERVAGKEGGRVMGLKFDPDAAAGNLDLWVAYDYHAGLSISDQAYTGVLARWQVPPPGRPGPVPEKVYIRGFASADHPVCGMAFGPDGRLYVSQGAMTMNGQGAKPGHGETPMTAAVLVADVRAEGFGGGQLPVDIGPGKGDNYDPFTPDAPVRVFATGVREAYDLCWHSGGNLYAGVNMNDTPQPSPAGPGVPSLKSVHPDEPLIRVVEGAHYGHPNPSLGRYVLYGGNPTEGKDPWEIPQYPVGVRPDPGFDPDLLIFNLAKVGGQSADGLAEYTHAGPLRSRLLVCIYTSTRTVGSFALAPDGKSVTEFDHLRGRDGEPLRFGAPLDLDVGPSGRVYVADFEDSRRGDAGRSGGVWLLTPAE